MEKKKVKIAADSACDLSDTIIKQYDISIIHHYISTIHGKFLDRDEITSDNVIEYLQNPQKTLDAWPPSVKSYEEFYKKNLESCDSLIHVVMSRGVSKSYLYACDAAKSFDNVFVVNSKSISVGYGMVVMKAAELCRSGMGAETIISELDEYRELVKFKFITPSLEGLKRSGRCPSALVDLTNFFKVHIDLNMKNDRMRPDKIYLGKMPWVYNQFIRNIFSAKNVDTRSVFIVTAGCTNKFAEEVQTNISKYYKFDNTFVTKASSTIACNSGMGAVGVAYASFNIK